MYIYRERDIYMCVYIYIYTHIYIYIYIYIYITHDAAEATSPAPWA